VGEIRRRKGENVDQNEDRKKAEETEGNEK
jgi:hypothetical protein